MTTTPATSTTLPPAKPARPRPAVMTVTPAAIARLKELTGNRTEPTVGLKIGIKKGGCAGMEYVMSWAETLQPFDEVIEVDGARVVIDKQAVMYLLGTEMDFKADKLSAQFVFNNPNQKSACGCGESINLVPANKDQLDALAG
ncbi:MAG: iron-sulfur cluster assembly accessory protein [Hyphomicrobiaceae bacterium]|nr:iron-sulfur cluster assembly accessory protein [Hyphomicrobiaceae bacterium]